MKKLMLLIISFLLSGSWLEAQVIPNNLGRIVEVATPNGVLPQFHTLIGWDSTGFIRQSSYQNSYRIFSVYPDQTYLNGTQSYSNYFNAKNLFSAPTGNDCYEIRYGSDSSHYWIGGVLAPNQVPFSVYNVGPRSASNPSVTGGTKICLAVTDGDGNGIYTPGEYINIYGDRTLPMDSTYADKGLMSTIPFSNNDYYLRGLRTGRDTVSYSHHTFNVTTDGILPPAGTVIRLVAETADSYKPILGFSDTVYVNDYFYSNIIGFYPNISTNFTLINAPAGMTVDSLGVIRWTISDNQIGNKYQVILKASNAYGTTERLIHFTHNQQAPTAGINEYGINIPGHNLRVYGLNSGEFPARPLETRAGMYFLPDGFDLLYAGGFYIGGQKPGVGGAPDTIVVSDVEFTSEFLPGRIMNQGPLGTLIAEDFTSNPTFYMLPDHYNYWPQGAPHDSLGNPLKLSAKDTWNVFNDIDSAQNTPNQHSPAPKMGLEIQRQTFMFTQYPFNNALLFRTRIINKSNYNYDSSYIGLWADPDVGADATRDMNGVDSALSLIYTYNDFTSADASNIAYGCLLLSGPVVNNVSDTARIVDISQNGFVHKTVYGKKVLMANSAVGIIKSWGSPGSAGAFDDKSRYWYMEGKDVYGNLKPFGNFDINDFYRADKRSLLGCGGPFTFAAGDTQDIWYAMIGAQGVSNPSAIDTLLNYAHLIKQTFNADMNVLVDRASPVLTLHALSTPAVNRLRFGTTSNKALSYLQMAVNNDTIDLRKQGEVWFGDYELTNQKSISIHLTGRDYSSNQTYLSRNYTLSKSGVSAKIGRYSLQSEGEGYILMRQNNEIPLPSGSLVLERPIEWMATGKEQTLSLSIDYTNDDIEQIKGRFTDYDESKIGLYGWNNNRWEPIESVIENNRIEATTSFKTVALMYNPKAAEKPGRFNLSQNYPNPFNPNTMIKYEIATSSKVTLKIYNLLGQEVKTLLNTQQSKGIHSVIWDGKNERGQMVGSGVYFYRLQAGDFVKTRKMVLVK